MGHGGEEINGRREGRKTGRRGCSHETVSGHLQGRHGRDQKGHDEIVCTWNASFIFTVWESVKNLMFTEVYFGHFQSESGGTVLSTDWSDIGKKQTDIKPPDGMEYKKYWSQLRTVRSALFFDNRELFFGVFCTLFSTEGKCAAHWLRIFLPMHVHEKKLPWEKLPWEKTSMNSFPSVNE